MKTKILKSTILGGIVLLAPLLAQAAGAPKERTDAPPITAYKLILVGDSTMATQSGWGSAFCSNHVKSSIACLNLGRGGRSTRSYRAEGSWDIALGEMKVPGYKATYVLIQMAHNDQSGKPERWTDETTEFPDNLRRFVKEARAAGAEPVLLTPLTRREFKDGELNNTLESWSDQVRKVAKELDVPLVDLNADSAAVVAKLGPVEAMKLAQTAPSEEEIDAARKGTTLPPKAVKPKENKLDRKAPVSGARGSVTRKFDYTHLGPQGAELAAAIVARDLSIAVPALSSQLLP